MPGQSLQTLASLIGQTGRFRTSDGLIMNVTIVDVKSAWGNLRYVIRAVDGSANTITVDATRVTVASVAA